jgi:hypothetical protein
MVPLVDSLRLHNIRDALAEPITDTVSVPSEFSATLSALGLYNTTQFVMRLSPKIHELVQALGNGDTEGYDPEEQLSAYSTYVHETIHWWQHVGSTAGLILSLCYPAQCLSNIEHLRETVRLIGPKKSLKSWAENALRVGTPPSDQAVTEANQAVNNTIDTEFYKAFALVPRCAEQLFDHRYFDSVGHSYSIAYASTIHALIDSCGFSASSLPNPHDWNEELYALRDARHEGFYRGSPIRRAHVGLLDIFKVRRDLVSSNSCTRSAVLPNARAIAKVATLKGIISRPSTSFGD